MDPPETYLAARCTPEDLQRSSMQSPGCEVACWKAERVVHSCAPAEAHPDDPHGSICNGSLDSLPLQMDASQVLSAAIEGACHIIVSLSGADSRK